MSKAYNYRVRFMSLLPPVASLNSQPDATSNRKHLVTAVLVAAMLPLTGCSISSQLKSAVPSVGIPANTSSFQKRFYAGMGVGSASLSPDVGNTGNASQGSQNSSASTIRLGYDVHNMLALEFDSAMLGTAAVNTAGTAEVQYSSVGASAVVYGFNSSAARSRREGWSGYGRLGLGMQRRSSNVESLDGNETKLTYGLGAEYGFANNLALRLEGSAYGSDAYFAGLGLVYRISNVKQFLPDNLREKETDGKVHVGTDIKRSSNGVAANKRTAKSGSQTNGLHPQALSVRVLATANDYDSDGVRNSDDKCPETSRGTAVNAAGCGLFDGQLAGVDFKNGSAGLSGNSREALDSLAIQLVAFPEVRVSIEGHTDDRGPADINHNVALSRASSVRRYLLNKGVAANQLETRSYGETKPIGDNETIAGQIRNRRIELVTLPNLALEEIGDDSTLIALASGSSNAAVTSSAVKSPKKVVLDEPMFAAARGGIDVLPKSVKVEGLDIGGVVSGLSFKPHTTSLTEESATVLDEIAAKLKSFPTAKAAVVAHTNTEDSAEANLALTQRQAKTITRALSRRGVNRRNLKALGFGDTLPLIQNVSEVHMAINRRIEIRLLEQ